MDGHACVNIVITSGGHDCGKVKWINWNSPKTIIKKTGVINDPLSQLTVSADSDYF